MIRERLYKTANITLACILTFLFFFIALPFIICFGLITGLSVKESFCASLACICMMSIRGRLLQLDRKQYFQFCRGWKCYIDIDTTVRLQEDNEKIIVTLDVMRCANRLVMEMISHHPDVITVLSDRSFIIDNPIKDKMLCQTTM